ncbi:MAG: histidine phosphatase family protein, partial [Nocardioidaceae bacterium]
IHTVEKRFSGPGGDDPGLTEEGQKQAMRAAEALRRDGGADVIIVSPLRRTRESAAIVSDRLGLPVQIEDGFRECAFGVWDGLTLAEVQVGWPDELDAWLGSMDVAPPGGESIVQVQQRVEKALAEVVAAYPAKSVVVVSHVNPIKLSVRHCLQAPIEVINRMQLAATSFTTISYYESGACSLRRFSALP